MSVTRGGSLENPLKRRGVMAGLVAATAAALARLSARPAEAASGQPVIQGQMNTPADLTGIQTTSVTAFYAHSDGAVGVQANSTNNLGVYGSSTNSIGVWGGSTNNIGFAGTATVAAGVYGQSNSAAGVQGVTTSGAGVLAQSTSGPGLQASSSSSYAGIFNGGLGVLVNGGFTATGIKSAAVPHPDGSLRRLYCLESPESWFEDFGAARLTGGLAHVELDGDFAAVVDSRDYRVFVTAEGDCRGLYVSGKTAHGFEVRELQRGQSNVAFSYRVVARRKDIAGPRLEPVARTTGVTPSAAPTLPAGLHR